MEPHPIPHWSLATRIAFRFSVVYLLLFSLVGQVARGLFLFSDLSFRGLGTVWPLREFTIWFARNVLGVAGALVYDGNSLDTSFFWVQTLWMLALAGLATVIWC